MKCKKPESELRPTRLLLPKAKAHLEALDQQADRVRHAGLTVKIMYDERQEYHTPHAEFYFGRIRVASWWPQVGQLFLCDEGGTIGKLTAKKAKAAVDAVLADMTRRRLAGILR